MDILGTLEKLALESGFASFFMAGGWKNLVMIVIAFVLLYLGIVKKFEPLLLIGIAFGCLLANLLSPYGVVDIVCGSLATLIAAFATAKTDNRYLAPLPPIIANGVIVGAMLSWYEVGFGAGFWKLFAVNGAWVALGEAVACYILGGLLLQFLPRSPFFRRMIPAKRLENLERSRHKH